MWGGVNQAELVPGPPYWLYHNAPATFIIIMKWAIIPKLSVLTIILIWIVFVLFTVILNNIIYNRMLFSLSFSPLPQLNLLKMWASIISINYNINLDCFVLFTILLNNFYNLKTLLLKKH